MADFRSLLSTFQTGTEYKASTISSSSNSILIGSTLKQKVEHLLRIAQIRKATTSGKDNISSTDDIHIAVCVCIVDEFPQEKIWKAWLDTSYSSDKSKDGSNVTVDTISAPDLMDNQKISSEIYIHAKFPHRVASPWVKSKLIKKNYRSNWNDVRIIRAMLALATEALRNSLTTHVLFATESCIPIATLSEVAIELLGRNEPHQNKHRSFVDAYKATSKKFTRFDERQCWGALSPYIPYDTIYKALPGWCLLSRKHIQKILDLPEDLGEDLWPAFEKVWAPEELYFPTALALIGALPSNEVVRKSLVFAKWDTKAKHQKDRAHPNVYDEEFGYNLVNYVRGEGCFFMRKLKARVNLRLWEDIVVRKVNVRNRFKDRQVAGNVTHHERGCIRDSASDYDPYEQFERKRNRQHSSYKNERSFTRQRQSDNYDDCDP